MTSVSKTVWITGASKGIGNALALTYLQKGYRVIATSRNIQKSDFKNDQNNPNLSVIAGDLSLKEENQRIVNRIFNDHKHVDIAVLNAGTCDYLSVDTLQSDSFEHLFKVNVFSVVYALEALLPHLLNTDATIAVTGSLAGYAGLPRASAYGGSKAAIHHIIDTLQIELSPYPLHLSLITPGFVDTPLTQQNDFKMPFLLSPEKAAHYIYKGIHKKKYLIQFPFIFSMIIRVLGCLPQRLRVALLARTLREKKQ